MVAAGAGGGGNREVLVIGQNVSVKQDESVLENCWTILYLELTIVYYRKIPM